MYSSTGSFLCPGSKDWIVGITMKMKSINPLTSDEETEMEKLNDSPKLTQLLLRKASGFHWAAT